MLLIAGLIRFEVRSKMAVGAQEAAE